MSSMYDAITQILTTHLGVPAEQIKPETTLDDIKADSLLRAELIVVLESRLAVSLPPELPLHGQSTIEETARVLQDAVDAGRLAA